MPGRHVTILAALLALVLPGCGGDEDDGGGGERPPPEQPAAPAAPSPAEWAADANALCRRYNAKADEILTRLSPGTDDPVGNARPLRAQVPLLRRQVAALRKLPEPRPPQRVRRFVARLDEAIELLPELAAGMASGDTESGAPVYDRLERIGPPLRSLARKLRVKRCIPFVVEVAIE